MPRPLRVRVRTFLVGAKPNAYCDRCIATSLEVDFRRTADEVREATSALEGLSEFGRGKKRCVLCGETRFVTWAN